MVGHHGDSISIAGILDGGSQCVLETYAEMPASEQAIAANYDLGYEGEWPDNDEILFYAVALNGKNITQIWYDQPPTT
jgi:hypothetical protein